MVYRLRTLQHMHAYLSLQTNQFEMGGKNVKYAQRGECVLIETLFAVLLFSGSLISE